MTFLLSLLLLLLLYCVHINEDCFFTNKQLYKSLQTHKTRVYYFFFEKKLAIDFVATLGDCFTFFEGFCSASDSLFSEALPIPKCFFSLFNHQLILSNTLSCNSIPSLSPYSSSFQPFSYAKCLHSSENNSFEIYP